MKNTKPELIAPAGDLEKLKIAFQYGADAVYASTPQFSMRTREIGFDAESLKEGIDYAHSLGKKVYLTVNIFPHSLEVEKIQEHIKKSLALEPDALIIADPGLVEYTRSISKIPIHLSTQANTTNHLSANFWQKAGVDRIVLARELSLGDIKALTAHSSVEIEAFVHGAMCMAYSGRCQISNYFTGRDPNKGACVQACRFKYKMYALEEDMRKGEQFPIYEDENGTYILNSKDLCMIDHLPEMIEAGVGSFKIEGRLKSIYYLAIITRAYRQAIDLACDSPKDYEAKRADLRAEVEKTSNRGFTTGFYFNKPDQTTNNYETSRAASLWDFVGVVKGFTSKTNELEIEAKNFFPKDSEIEIVTPDEIIKAKFDYMIYRDEKIEIAHSGYLITVPAPKEVPINSFVRIKSAK